MEDGSNKQELRKYIPFNQNEYGLLIRNLSEEHIDLMGEFSQKIYSALGDNEKTFIYPRKTHDFKKAMEEGDIFIGIFDENKLIGLSSLHNMGNNEALFCADSVSQSYRNHGLNSQMIEIRTDLAKILGYTTVKADIDVDNYKNVIPYLRNDFIITATEKDETDGGTVYKLEKKLEKIEKYQEDIEKKEIGFDNHGEIAILLNKGYIGTGIKKWEQGLFLILTKAA